MPNQLFLLSLVIEYGSFILDMFVQGTLQSFYQFLSIFHVEMRHLDWLADLGKSLELHVVFRAKLFFYRLYAQIRILMVLLKNKRWLVSLSQHATSCSCLQHKAFNNAKILTIMLGFRTTSRNVFVNTTDILRWHALSRGLSSLHYLLHNFVSFIFL